MTETDGRRTRPPKGVAAEKSPKLHRSARRSATDEAADAAGRRAPVLDRAARQSEFAVSRRGMSQESRHRKSPPRA